MQRPKHHIFTYNARVQPEDIDQLGHVSNVVYVRWIAEASAAHWFKLAPKSITEKYIWVVVRHEIDYLSSALLNDDVAVYTWVGEHSTATSTRYVEICSALSGKIFVKAKTTWCLLTAQNMKPARIDGDMKDLLNQTTK